MKSTLRKIILAERSALSAVTRAEADAQVLSRLLSLPSFQSARGVLGYMNFGTEFASEAWVAAALAAGKRVALPRVNPATKRLDLYWVEEVARQLVVGSWGIREPSIEGCERLRDTNEVEFALLPGVAFTRRGARLGYGGGFYDKLLGGWEARPPLVAAAYGVQVVDELPVETTDVFVDWLITEQETLHCAVRT